MKSAPLARGLLCALALVLPLAGCGKKEEAKPEDTPAPGETPGEADEAGEAAAPPSTPSASGGKALLTYLEPEATGVLYMNLPPDIGRLDGELVSTVFALPPRGRDLVNAALGVDTALASVLGPDAPPPSEILGPETLVMTPAVSTGSYVLRPLAKPAAEVEALLTKDAMQRSESDGTTVLAPTGAFPFKAALLEGDVIAFIPKTEIGSGLSPLTAGRDLPPSEVRTELSTMLDADPGVVLVGVVAGPMLHLDLTDDVALARIMFRKWEAGGLDVEIRMQTTGDPATAAKELEERTAPLETDQVQSLVDRVAFTVDGPTVAGKLQLTKDDVANLRKSN
jgi:hypothetical protein